MIDHNALQQIIFAGWLLVGVLTGIAVIATVIVKIIGRKKVKDEVHKLWSE